MTSVLIIANLRLFQKLSKEISCMQLDILLALGKEFWTINKDVKFPVQRIY